VPTPTADSEFDSEQMRAFIRQYANDHAGTFKVTLVPSGYECRYDLVVHSGANRKRIRTRSVAGCWDAVDFLLCLFPGVTMKRTMAICHILEGQRGVGCVLVVIKRNKVVRVRFLRKVTHP
jgi:hypothetical protein